MANVSLTSDFDYLKIFDDGLLSVTTAAPTDADFQFPNDPFGGFGFGEQGIATVTHGLGEIPIVRAFIDPAGDGTWYSSMSTIGLTVIDPSLLVLIDTLKVKFCVNSLFSGHKSNVPVFYRIYYPGDKGVDSDSRIDKIFSKSPDGYSQTVGAAAASNDPIQSVIPISHSQGEPILWTLQFSADGVNWYNDGNFVYGGPDLASGPPGGPYSYYYYMRVYGSGTNDTFSIRLEHNYPTSKQFFLRWALDYRQ